MTKHKSRAGKKNQRKNADIKDVEEFMEMKAQEEAIGAPIEALPSDDLFFIDKSGAKSGQAKGLKKRKLDESAIKKVAPSAPSRYQEQLVNRLLKKKKQKTGGQKADPEITDLWESASSTDPSAGMKTRDRANLTDFIQDVVVKKAVKRPTPSSFKPTEVPNVVLPLPGQSVNPSATDHEDAIGIAFAEELQKEEAKQRHMRKMRPLTYAQREEAAARCVSDEPEGETFAFNRLNSVPMTVNVTDAEDDDSEVDVTASAEQKPSHEERMSKKERSRQARLREQARQRDAEQNKKQLLKNINRVGELTKELKMQEKTLSLRREFEQRRKEGIKQQERQGIIVKPKRLGKTLYEAPATVEQVLLPDELPTSLRTAPTDVTLAMKDRYDSIFRRSLLEPTKPGKQPKNRAWYKMHEKGGKRAFSSEDFSSSLRPTGPTPTIPLGPL